MSRQRETVRLPRARPRTPRPVFVWSTRWNLFTTFEMRELRARRTWAGRRREARSKARQREDVAWSAMLKSVEACPTARQRETVGWSMTLKLGQRVGSREAQGWSMVW